jgi:hypothetical protein
MPSMMGCTAPRIDLRSMLSSTQSSFSAQRRRASSMPMPKRCTKPVTFSPSAKVWLR